MISQEEQQLLLRLARLTLEKYVRTQKKLTLEEYSFAKTSLLKKNAGVFVTLYHHFSTRPKELRGCIGTIEALYPLYEAVMKNTVNACSQDRRFTPVQNEELSEIKIDINVLSTPVLIDSYSQIVLGRDGIILTCGSYRSVFLPSVPIEWRWSLEETLMHLSRKAGLPMEGWRHSETTLHTFQTTSFSE